MADRVPGRIEGVHLSSDGKRQALWISQFLKNKVIDVIYSSPLDRAIETAEPLAQLKNLQIYKLKALEEIDFGDWTGQKFDDLEKDFQWKQFHFYRNGCQIPGGELMVQVQMRLVAAIEHLQTIHSGKIIAVFSHNDPIKSLLAFYGGVSLDLFQRIVVSTGSLSKISLNACTVKILFVNMTEMR
jgi:probable phosphoglycerate mutase